MDQDERVSHGTDLCQGRDPILPPNPDFISVLCKVGNLEREKVGQVVEVSSLEEMCSHSVLFHVSLHLSLSFKKCDTSINQMVHHIYIEQCVVTCLDTKPRFFAL